MKIKRLLFLLGMGVIFSLLFSVNVRAQETYTPEFSTAGFFETPGSGRRVYSMNPAWRLHKGAAEGAQRPDYDDAQWAVVSLPDGIEPLPTEASGCVNYQGEVWYRKHFMPADSLRGKKLFLHFEAIMGKSRVYVNGELLTEHYGGYLPVVVNVTQALRWGQDNVIAVWADNSDDPNYPPGKAQDVLDFTYFGGIYRDCWLIAHRAVYLTDPNYEKVTAGGGLVVASEAVSEASARLLLKAHLRNDSTRSFKGVLEYQLRQADGTLVASTNSPVNVKAGKATTVSDRLEVLQPRLWSPDSPTLYDLIVCLRDRNGKAVDGYRRRVGIRSIEFRGKDGFWLNGKPYDAPLIGANRHQDFAVVGNAVPNSLHWRDAKKLRDAGLRVVRNAHCPQDPAFMDACDELGLFVIVNTPGWQFWNKEPHFAERVYDDIRNLVRRDRNHPCVWLWEPILNETWYPADFALKAKNLVAEEYPYPSCYSGSDSGARGHEHYPVQFSHPSNGDKDWAIKELDPKVTYFTREWGDNVDDWNAHNSPSRVARNWGEHAMLVQARHYAAPDYDYTSYDALFRTTRQHVGGCLWHSFDHQRGYHPDPFYGGIMDVFRQPKYSYYMFQAQRPAQRQEGRLYETGPMVYVAHEMTPFSPADVTVYSNCEEVRLTYNKGGKVYTYTRPLAEEGMPSPIITFKDVYSFMADKALSRKGKQADSYLLAEGLVDGKVVATHRVRPARRPSQIVLALDNEKTPQKADGGDLVTVVASITDRDGNVKHLNNYFVKFQVEGEGRIVGGAGVLANPAPVKWGAAPVLVRSTLRPGKVKLTASVLFEGSQLPATAVLEWETVPADHPMVYDEAEAQNLSGQAVTDMGRPAAAKSAEEITAERRWKEAQQLKLKEVERQQTEFGEQREEGQ